MVVDGVLLSKELARAVRYRQSRTVPGEQVCDSIAANHGGANARSASSVLAARRNRIAEMT